MRKDIHSDRRTPHHSIYVCLILYADSQRKHNNIVSFQVMSLRCNMLQYEVKLHK
jgi:hypothetical protein